MEKFFVSQEVIQEAKNIIDGVYAPLKGFLGERDFFSVLQNMRLSSGEIWPLPIIIDIERQEAEQIKGKGGIILTDGRDEIILEDIEIYRFEKNFLNQKLFGTTDIDHPGVARTIKMGRYLLGGKVSKGKFTSGRHQLNMTPDETREIFRKNNWKHVVAFQTRNPPHCSHEHLQKTALKKVDGLFINPVIGPKKEGDFKDKHILEAYNIIIEKYYPKNNVVFGTFHTFMRYAGPKEALFHALVRRNFGCTHMIIGRDHAGVGSFYGAYDAQKIFDNFDPKELGIEIFKFENAAYCYGCKDMAIGSECGHADDKKVHISGTNLRDSLLQNQPINDKIMRKEVVEYLLNNQEDLFV